MAKERKKVEKKPVKKVAPKKRPEPQPEPPKQRKPKSKPSDDKYIRIPTTASQEEFKVIGDRVQRGELKWAYYAGEGDKGAHYYIVLNPSA